MSAVCDDLRLGGVRDSEGITGGTTINGTMIAVDDWTGLLGHSGISYTPIEVSGRAGGFLVGDALPKHRFPTLNMRIKSLVECGDLDDPEEVLLANTDAFLALLAKPDGNFLEVDLPDGTKRHIKAYAIDATAINQPMQVRRLSVPLYSPEPYWSASVVNSQVITGAEVIPVGGNVSVYDAILSFAGNGTFTHTGLDWSIEVSGAPGPVIVDLGERTVTEAGGPADQWLRPSNRLWGWFRPGNNNVTSDVSVTVLWRNQYN